MVAAQCYGPWAETIARAPLGFDMISPQVLRFILAAARFQNGVIPGNQLPLCSYWWVRLMIGRQRHPASPLPRAVAGGLKRMAILAHTMISMHPIHRSAFCAALVVPRTAQRPLARILPRVKMLCAACPNSWRA